MSTLIGERFYCLHAPRDFPLHWTAIVSSHRHRDQTANKDWTRYLESALKSLSDDESAVLVAPDAAAGAAIEHVVRRLRLPMVKLCLPAVHATLETWMEDCIQQCDDPSSKGCARLWVSPLVSSNAADGVLIASPWKSPDIARHDDDRAEEPANVPLVDRCLIAMPDRVHALQIRRNGKTTKLLHRRLREVSYPLGSTRVTLTRVNESRDAQDANVTHELLENGAVGWFVNGSRLAGGNNRFEVESRDSALVATHAPMIDDDGRWLRQQAANGWRFLTHCTRARQGAWPDQSWAQYRDEILLSGGTEQSSPLQTLARILSQQRILATDGLRSGDRPTVCFSEVPLLTLLGRRSFRSHLGRWDWEPYGVCVRTKWLIEQGARKVEYVDREQWKSYTQREQLYLHPIAKGERDCSTGTWEQEQEWRIVDDLRLNSIPFESAFVFVRTANEARIIEKLSRWPVVVVGVVPSDDI